MLLLTLDKSIMFFVGCQGCSLDLKEFSGQRGIWCSDGGSRAASGCWKLESTGMERWGEKFSYPFPLLMLDYVSLISECKNLWHQWTILMFSFKSLVFVDCPWSNLEYPFMMTFINLLLPLLSDAFFIKCLLQQREFKLGHTMLKYTLDMFDMLLLMYEIQCSNYEKKGLIAFCCCSS